MHVPVATWDDVRRLALGLPEVEESTSYGRPALKVRGKLIACRRQDDARVIVLRVDPAELELMLRARPEAFFITPHYAGYPYVLVRLDEMTREEIGDLVTDAWLIQAPRRLASAFLSEAG
jgi:hypothetical protein